MFKMISISLGFVALSAAGGFALSISHKAMTDTPRLALTAPAPVMVSQAMPEAAPHVGPVTMIDIAPSSTVPLLALAPDGYDSEPVLATRGYDDMGRTDLAPLASIRPRARGGDAPAPRPLPDAVADRMTPEREAAATQSDTLVMAAPLPHDFGIAPGVARPVLSNNRPKPSGRPISEPVPRYLIGVFR